MKASSPISPCNSKRRLTIQRAARLRRALLREAGGNSVMARVLALVPVPARKPCWWPSS